MHAFAARVGRQALVLQDRNGALNAGLDEGLRLGWGLGAHRDRQDGERKDKKTRAGRMDGEFLHS